MTRPAHILFFAAVPPPDIKAQMASAWQRLGTGEPFRHDTLHLSIYAVAGVDKLGPGLINRARQAVRNVRTAPFMLCFDRLMRFNRSLGDYPLVLTTEKASTKPGEIAADLHAGCRAAGLPKVGLRKVTPHVTLAYGAGLPEERLIDTPICWQIDEITLIDSHQGKGRHEILGQWRLPEGREQPGFDF